VTTHTIGEVLNRLKDEFDDITISKIRFLEAEGLISPDRTESGYRKFSEGDVERLRYVLRAQRDRYLPLKVIKDELSRLDAGLPLEASPVGDGPQDTPAAEPAGERAGVLAGGNGFGRSFSLLESSPSDLQLTATELADATGLTDRDLADLRDHGLLGPGPAYDGDDLRVVKLAAELIGTGLEARHVRMYRQFAEREASLIEQLVAPLLRQRNPDSRRVAREQAERLAAAGGDLHRALLAKQLQAILRS